MTNEEKTLLISYLIDAGEMDPAGDVEAQFLDWYQVREGQVSGETHYKAILDAARVSKRSLRGRTEGRLGRTLGQAGLGPAGDRLGPAPLYGTRPPDWGLTPGPHSRIHVAPSGWAAPPAWDQEGREKAITPGEGPQKGRFWSELRGKSNQQTTPSPLDREHGGK